MKKLFSIADQYIQESTWKDLALIKFCLCAMGVLIGTIINPRYKKITLAIASSVFIVTYIPLMGKFFDILFRKLKVD